jgi:hypothetical protein
MAHNGWFGELGKLEEQLGPYASLVLGDTDSERYFALITQQADAHGGDVTAGSPVGVVITTAAGTPGALPRPEPEHRHLNNGRPKRQQEPSPHRA